MDTGKVQDAAADAAVAVVGAAMQVYVETPGLNDVLCGRGGATNQHEGNVKYRALVQSRQHEYLHAAKSDKKQVALSIVKIIKSKGGRFLKKCEDGRVGWVDIGSKKAREKTSQALREGLDALKKDLIVASDTVAAATAATAAAAETDAKRKAEGDAAGDGSKKKKAAAKTSPTAAPVLEDSTAATDDIAAAAEAAMLAAPNNNNNNNNNRTPPPPTGTFADAAKAAFTATAGDYANDASAPGVATDEINAATAAPELVVEKAPAYNVPVPAPALSYFDYAASFALSTSAGAGASSADASAGSFNYPGTSNLGGYGYPYPFPGYPPVGSSYGHYGLGYDTNLYASAAASFGIPPPPVTGPVDNGDDDDEGYEEEAFVVGETAQI